MSPGRHIRVVGDEPSREAVAKVLAAAGFGEIDEADSVSEGPEAPSLLCTCGEEAVLLCSAAREQPELADIPLLCVVAPLPADAAGAALAAGADEVVVGPPSPAVLGNRVRRLLRRFDDRQRAHELETLQEALFKVQALMGEAPETLRAILLLVRQHFGVDRASLISHVEGSEHAYVVAATDDPNLSQLRLQISDYPELIEAMETHEPLFIDDALDHPVTRRVAPVLEGKQVRGVAVFPLVWRRRSLGTLLLRQRRPADGPPSQSRIHFGKMTAGMIAAHLRHDTMMERLDGQTRRISRASYEAERRLRTIESLKEHFEASADGVVVLDDEGHILFVNGTAETITGFAADGLIGSRLVDLVSPHQREPLQDVIRGVLGGTNLQAFDLNLSTTSGQPICVSVTTSTVLAKSGAVILSFRDVTEQRSLEGELRQTKDFLEKLISSTVDAIIAADLKGRLLLFNPGAERIYGYRAEEAITGVPVWKLYPEGVARQVMRMLRSTSYGGVGKLEQTRREVLTRDGDLVPVNMTASIIYEEGREVATVGIFSDLRERIRMEQRLLQAQEKIEMQERLAMVAQLAGAAAHELNQPLTSILAYAELIERQSEPEAPHRRPVEVIQREAERMADIVKKIGRITRYETKEYIGSERIVDLDRSAASGEFQAQEPSIIVDRPRAGEEDDFEEPTRQLDADAEVPRRQAAGKPGRSHRRREQDPDLYDDSSDEESYPTMRLDVFRSSHDEAESSAESAGDGDHPRDESDRDDDGEDASGASDERRFV